MSAEAPIHDEPIPGFDGLYGLEVLEATAELGGRKTPTLPHSS